MEESPNLKKAAYNFIVDSLANGKLKSGKIVDLDKVSRELGISRTPVKEALIELQGEGLISRQGRFYTIFVTSERDIISLYEAREVLEAQSSMFAALRASDEEIQEMGKLMERISEASKRKVADPVVLSDMNGEFHTLVAKASKNDFLERYSREIRMKLRVARASLFTSADRVKNEVREHSQIFRAISDHDPEAAWKTMMQHQNNVMQYIKEKGIKKIV